MRGVVGGEQKSPAIVKNQGASKASYQFEFSTIMEKITECNPIGVVTESNPNSAKDKEWKVVNNKGKGQRKKKDQGKCLTGKDSFDSCNLK